LVADAVIWRPASPGVEWGEITLAGTGTAWRIRVILVRLDPSRLAFELAVPPRTRQGFAGRWTIQDAPGNAVLAFNAGQFKSGPWGWLVRNGTAEQPPGTGPLAPGVLVDTTGRVRIATIDSLPFLAGEARIGFQSYPDLLRKGRLPFQLRFEGQGVDLTHRDARLGLGTLADGRVLIAMTRWQGLGGVLEVVPFGFTTPEMAAVMGALGSRDAILMDGGISSQLLLMDHGKKRSWPGLRGVALGLIVRAARP
jgi:hypothetical protein